jgi:hypothetical protein
VTVREAVPVRRFITVPHLLSQLCTDIEAIMVNDVTVE